jgi:glutathione S-transferase
MDELVLYSNPWSRGRIARWALEEVGQPYRVEVVDYATMMKAEPYLSLNPMGKVPTLVHGRTVATENAAVVTYLADAFPQAGLMPADRGRFYRWMFFGAGPVDAAVTNAALGVEVPPEKMRMVGYGSMELVVNALERALADAPYLCGEAFSAADLFVGSQVGWAMHFGTMPQSPVLAEWWDRSRARPAAARAAALDDALVKKE